MGSPHFLLKTPCRVFCKGFQRRGRIPPARGRRYLEAPVNLLPLVYSRDPTPGRFTLYPTETMWTFILLDQTDGRTWQVQWSLDGKEGIVPINALPTY